MERYSEAEFVAKIMWVIEQEGSQTAAAKRLHVSAQYLNDVVHGRREPGTKIYAAMGYRREVQYCKVGGSV